MKKHLVIILASLLIILMMGVSVWAASDTVNFWPLPGESWTLSNPTDEDIAVNTRTNCPGLAYVITDAEGYVTARTAKDNSSKSPVIPAGGKAIIMNRGLGYALDLDPRIIAEKDSSPALLIEELSFGESCEFRNTTGSSADVLLYSANGALSYVIFDASGHAETISTKVNSSGGTQNTTVQVPAGGSISVMCGTQGLMTASNSRNVIDLSVLCMARAKNFTVTREAEAALGFYSVAGDESRAFRNVSGQDCDVYMGYTTYVLYDAGGHVEKSAAVSVGSTSTLSVPAGYSVSFTAGTDGFGAFAVPLYAFEETDLPGVVYTFGPADSFTSFENITGEDAVVYGASKGSMYASSAAWYPEGIAAKASNGAGVVVPAGHVLVTGNSTAGVYTVDGKFKISASADPDLTKAVTVDSECFLVRNNSSHDQRLYVSSSSVSVRYYGTEYDWLERSYDGGYYYTIPSGRQVEVNPSKALSSFNIYGAYKALKIERRDPINVGSYYTCDEGDIFKVTNLKTNTQYFSFAGQSIKLVGSKTLYVRVSTPAYMSLMSKNPNSNLEVVQTGLFNADWHHVELEAGESCVFTNTTGEMAWLYYNGMVDSRVFNEDGSVYSYGNETGLGMSGTNAVVQVPAGASLHLTGVRGLSTIDCRRADFALTKDSDPVSARVTVHKGETWRYEWATDNKISGAYRLVNYDQIEKGSSTVTRNLIDAIDTVRFVGWADRHVEKIADTPLFEDLVLGEGDACSFTIKDFADSVTSDYIYCSDPMLGAYFRKEPSPGCVDHDLEFTAKIISRVDYEYPQGSLYAFTDDSVITYCPFIYDAQVPDSSPFLTAVIPDGKGRDFTAGNMSDYGEKLYLFGLGPQYQQIGYDGFFGEPIGSNAIYFYSWDGLSRHVIADGSDVFAIGLKQVFKVDTVPLRPSRAKTVDKNGAETSGIQDENTASIIIKFDVTDCTPEELDMVMAQYDEVGRMIRCDFVSFPSGDITGGEIELPFEGNEEVDEVNVMSIDEEAAPIIEAMEIY